MSESVTPSTGSTEPAPESAGANQRAHKIPGQGKPKDTALKVLFQDNAVFAEVFNHTILKDRPIDPANLREMDTDESAILSLGGGSQTTVQLFRDVAKSLLSEKTFGDDAILAILSVENQMHVHYRMPLWVMQTQFLNYARQAYDIMQANRETGAWTEGADKEGEYLYRFRKTDRIRRVICLVIYYGEHPWDGPRSLEDMYVPSGLPGLGACNPLYLLDVLHMTDEELKAFPDILRLFFGMLRAMNSGTSAEYVSENSKQLSNMPFVAAAALAELTGSEDLKAVLNDYANDEGGVNYVNLFQKEIDRWRDEGFRDGEVKGFRDGEVSGADSAFQTVAESMIADGVMGEMITKYSHLDRDTIDSIARSLNRTVSWNEARA